jgi:hypothetical protein
MGRGQPANQRARCHVTTLEATVGFRWRSRIVALPRDITIEHFSGYRELRAMVHGCGVRAAWGPFATIFPLCLRVISSFSRNRT